MCAPPCSLFVGMSISVHGRSDALLNGFSMLRLCNYLVSFCFPSLAFLESQEWKPEGYVWHKSVRLANIIFMNFVIVAATIRMARR